MWTQYTHNPASSMGRPTADRLMGWFNDMLSKTKEGPLTKREAARWAKDFSRAEGDSDKVDDVLDLFDKRTSSYGIEGIRGEYQVDNYYYDVVGLYMNTGDTYSPTIVYDTEREQFVVTTFGDWVEKNQRKYRII